MLHCCDDHQGGRREWHRHLAGGNQWAERKGWNGTGKGGGAAFAGVVHLTIKSENLRKKLNPSSVRQIYPLCRRDCPWPICRSPPLPTAFAPLHRVPPLRAAISVQRVQAVSRKICAASPDSVWARAFGECSVGPSVEEPK